MNVKKVRQSLGLTQADFWRRLGITQSGGSRYESQKRELWAPVEKLVLIAYGTDTQREKVLAGLRPK